MKTVPDFWFEPRPWLDGQWFHPSPSETFTVSNPATCAHLADVIRADAATVQRAIEGVVKAQKSWRETPAATRGEILKRTAVLLIERKDAFARLLSAEQGKPYAQAAGEVDYAASFFQWFGEEARRVSGRLAPHPAPGREFFVETKPAGVAGLITPWNFPLAQGAKKVAASLAAGCTAIWKPAELTPLIALATAPLLAEAGLPPGVLQIVPGSGSVVGGVLAEHPAVRVLSLTGSTATGSALMSRAAGGIKRLSFELGGNAPFIVLPDADLDFAADELVHVKLLCSGQVCVTANRVFIHADVEAAFTEKVASRLAAAQVGNGLADGVDAGPLIHRKACEEVGALVTRAQTDGARIVCENRSFERDPSLREGSFAPLTLVTGVRDEMPLARDEVFGPVISLLSYATVADAVRRANETPYGLAAYVYGRDLSLCRAVASGLEVGIVGVNEWRPLKAEIPFGGVKMSGLGSEGGVEGIREFLDTQVISMPKPTFDHA
ncbi:Aldehyde Dehydrogenase [Chthoniobacter flavus Ellin428]|uniref:Aldehyde Dehydrogenase n=1 Tax=Chthoniobacter flavus Ellin428 TaxID=497964 RepID=B4D7J8_9BACT|nr:NAD-dependent succinate-semialdehyde dehydrogenase [Chthoniobacter flavus]EDY17615.1 Aldehyde Dehydrogenase [Chthoniobacter flavus Ellin428]TCO92356.1 succinate semialdehyde dehydrogenase [Chthoniobacter flavus]